MGLKFLCSLLIAVTIQVAYGQTVDRSTYAVFSPAAPNDSLMVAGGQIMTGDSDAPNVEHGYYPLNHSLVSIQEPILNATSFIYPNPFTAHFSIRWNNPSQEKVTVEIYSINGELLQVVETTNTTLEVDMRAYARGIYYVSAYSNGAVVLNQKIIKS